MSKVVHCKKALYDAMIDRSTIFGNPFVMKNKSDDERRRVIFEYKAYFHKRIVYDSKFASAVERLRGKTLGCWCRPLPCHGDVILEWFYQEASK